MRYYPAFLNLEGKQAVVVGGGAVAERKVAMLLRAGADVTVVSPVLSRSLRNQEARGRITAVKRPYRKGDLNGAFLVVAASDDPAVNSRVSADAPGLVNVVDTPHECTFIVPSIVRRGPLTIAISTSGASPALAKSIRKEIEQLFGKEFSSYLSFARKMRAAALKQIPDQRARQRFLKEIGSPRMLRMLRQHGLPDVQSEARRLLEVVSRSVKR